MNNSKGPDTRGWVAIGLFVLVGFVLALLAFKPELSKDELFDTLASNIVVSGLIGGVVAYLFGSSKGSDDKTAIIAHQAQGSPVQTPPASTSVNPTDEVTRRPSADADGSQTNVGA